MNTLPSQLIREIASLKQKKGREEFGWILVEGRHPIEEAIRAGLMMRHAFILPEQTGGLPQEAFPLAPFAIDEKTMGRMSSTSSPPPCLAVFDAPEPVSVLPGSRVLVLDSIQDPGNLGTLIRSALAFGFDAVVLAGDSVDAYNPKVIRSSAGLVFALPVLEVSVDAVSALFAASAAGSAGWTFYAATASDSAALQVKEAPREIPAALSYRAVQCNGPCALILGNEGRGISAALLADRMLTPVTIPMRERVESLNVAISGSIIMAEMASRDIEQPVSLASSAFSSNTSPAVES